MSADRKPSWASQRHRARTLALQMIFEADFSARSVDEIYARRLAEEDVPARVAAYAQELFHGAYERREEYDSMIARLAPTWPLEQMARIDRNILRLALYEVLESPEVPMRAAINEAVELAKEFGSDASSRFINGVLGTVAAQRTEARDGQADEPEDGEPQVAPGES
ncbi:MAG: transcription antitermination factor NusB [Chloroflexota bacterium]|nr:transcription antitermination factor NusB [Chloroflexota bacterium]